MEPAAQARSRTLELLRTADEDELPPLDQLIPLVFHELQKMAHHRLARDPNNVTLQTTALVHEAYLKLAGDSRVTERGRAYFFAAAARAMRQVLVDASRRRRTGKRGGGVPISTLAADEGGPVDAFATEMLDLDEALEELGHRNPRQMQVVEFRYFGGMSIAETASVLGVSERTVKADWTFARAWLYRTLEGPTND